MLRCISIECASLINLTAELEVNYSPKGTAVVSASIVNNEFYGCADYGVGRISLRNRASVSGFAHEYERHGATTLFAAPETTTGLVKRLHKETQRQSFSL